MSANDDCEVFIAGYFSGALELASGVSATVEGHRGFIARLDGTGTPRWLRTLSSFPMQPTVRLAAAPDDGVIALATWAGGVGVASGGCPDASTMLTRFDRDGTSVWQLSVKATCTAGLGSLATNTAGDIFVAGWFSGALTFGGEHLDSVSPGSSQAFVAKLDLGGGRTWYRRSAPIIAIATDDRGGVVGVGSFDAPVDDRARTFTLRLCANGDTAWSREPGGYGVAVAGDDIVVVPGAASGCIAPATHIFSRLDSGGYLRSTGCAEETALFHTIATSQGSRIWLGFGRDLFDVPFAAAVPTPKRFGADFAPVAITGDVDGAVLFGMATQAVDFGQGPLSGGPNDLVVARLLP